MHIHSPLHYLLSDMSVVPNVCDYFVWPVRAVILNLLEGLNVLTLVSQKNLHRYILWGSFD